MFKPTASLLRKASRLPLTTKGARKGFYKGNRTGSLGEFRKHGHYRIDLAKVRTYVVPDLTDFKLTPFIARTTEKPAQEEKTKTLAERIEKGREYLEDWKMRNGQE